MYRVTVRSVVYANPDKRQGGWIVMRLGIVCELESPADGLEPGRIYWIGTPAARRASPIVFTT